MKHNIFYLFGALAVLASCTKEIEKTEESVSTTAKERVTIIAQTPQTKTTAEVNGDDVDFSWQASEKIAVVEQDAVLDSDEKLAGALFTISNQSDGYFTGTKTAGKDLVFAVSPAQALTEADLSSGTSYTIELPATYSNYVSGTTNAVMIGVPDGDPVENTYKFKFSHAAALIKYVYENVPVGTTGFKFTTDANITGSFSLSETSGVTLTTPGAGTKSVTIMLPSAISSLNQKLVFYVPVPAGEYGLFRSVLVCGNGNNINEIAATLKKKTLSTKVGLEKGDVFITPTITLDNTVDVLTYAFTELSTGNDGYTSWSGKNGASGVVYAGGTNMNQGTVSHNYIQLRNDSGKKDAGIYTTANSSERIARKVSVTWATAQSTATGRYITVYGKSTAYSSVADLYSSDTRGEELGTITKADNVSTASLAIADNKNYEYIGLLASQPLYCDEIDITWEGGKPAAGIAWLNSNSVEANSGNGTIYLGDSNTTTGAPSFSNPNNISTSEITFSSTKESVATVDTDGFVTIVGAGETTIKAKFDGSASYGASTVQYVLTVSDVTERAISTSGSNGTIVTKVAGSSVSSAKAGDVVTIETTPATNYVRTALTVTETVGGATVSMDGDSFIMPAKAVTVTVTFTRTYAINIVYGTDPANGSAVAKVASSTVTRSVADANVTIEAVAATGYALESISSEDVTITQGSFTMPAKDVTVTVTFAISSKPDDETLDFVDLYGTTSTDIVDEDIEGDHFSVVFKKSDGSTAPKYYTATKAAERGVRAYAKNTFTITAEGSHTISEITLTFASGEGSNTITTDSTTYDSGTWTGTTAKKTVTFTIGGTSGHRRIKAISVKYAN